VKLIDGAVQNLMINDEKGEEQLLTIIGNNDAVMISPSDNDSIIEYDLDNVLSQKDNVCILKQHLLSFLKNLI
jgi:sporulation protein YlmC with PRC-barrel domain